MFGAEPQGFYRLAFGMKNEPPFTVARFFVANLTWGEFKSIVFLIGRGWNPYPTYQEEGNSTPTLTNSPPIFDK